MGGQYHSGRAVLRDFTPAYACCASLADIAARPSDVRFTPLDRLSALCQKQTNCIAAKPPQGGGLVKQPNCRLSAARSPTRRGIFANNTAVCSTSRAGKRRGQCYDCNQVLRIS